MLCDSNCVDIHTPKCSQFLRLSQSTSHTLESTQDLDYDLNFKQITKKIRLVSFSLDSINQSTISTRMRLKLLDWIISVCWNYRIDSDGLYLTLTLVDVSLANILIKKQQLQALGLTCLYIASKYSQHNNLKMAEILALCKNAFKSQVILGMEEKVLNAVDFDLEIPNINSFWQIYKSKNAEYLSARRIQQIDFLCELSILHHKGRPMETLLNIIHNQKSFLKELLTFGKTLQFRSVINKYLSCFDCEQYLSRL